MAVKFSIEGGDSGRVAKVNDDGALAVGPASYNEVKFNELAVTGTAYNNATVEIYEASSTSSATVDKIIMQFEIGQNEFHPFTSLSLLVNAGKWINAKTDDDDVHMNILGYYVDEVK
ncbi:hypothetical protein LCGC14_2968350 [marine sediment metagenome]|uniref:Uncharacterized protein n=1 Tax=marine sediment metagenome TaxID=412755 RepID=A0A0F8XB30_9ZZZZ